MFSFLFGVSSIYVSVNSFTEQLLEGVELLPDHWGEPCGVTLEEWVKILSNVLRIYKIPVRGKYK